MDESRVYYVYQWVNDDTQQIFYVGKGSKERYKDKRPSRRNQYFMRYIKKHPNCHGEKIVENLTEAEAYEIEKETIAKYKEQGIRLTNLDEGGRAGGRCPGESNGMFGKTHTKEAVEKIRAANIGKTRSKNSNSRVCEIYNLDMELLAVFSCIQDAIDWMKSDETSHSDRSMRTYIYRYELGQIDNLFGRYKLKIYRHGDYENTVPSLEDEEGRTTIES